MAHGMSQYTMSQLNMRISEIFRVIYYLKTRK